MEARQVYTNKNKYVYTLQQRFGERKPADNFTVLYPKITEIAFKHFQVDPTYLMDLYPFTGRP